MHPYSPLSRGNKRVFCELWSLCNLKRCQWDIARISVKKFYCVRLEDASEDPPPPPQQQQQPRSPKKLATKSLSRSSLISTATGDASKGRRQSSKSRPGTESGGKKPDQATVVYLNFNQIFFKNGPIPYSFSVNFRLFNMSQFKFNLIKACDSNPGWQDCRRRRFHWATVAPLNFFFIKTPLTP